MYISKSFHSHWFLSLLITLASMASNANIIDDTSRLGQYIIDDIILGRKFDGIGAISGGGATSKLLPNYPDKQRDEVLDYLFKPDFGASLHILKVEIGGDSQSTDGTEASHMHSHDDLNLNRGYEWWLMKEAKKRNPNIKLYGLPWVWPGWLGPDTFSPYTNINNTVTYITNWVDGASKIHALHIDYIGIWNERSYSADYIKALRVGLDKLGYYDVQIVVADGGWGVVNDLKQDQDLRQAVNVVGVHYPGATSPNDALKLGLPLWASEEYSARNDQAGAGCWARVLAESYIGGYFTGVIAWNLLTSYYNNLPYSRSSLMTANQPWAGHYSVDTPIWATAHFTQFTRPGWFYYHHGLGVGTLAYNGSYVSLVSDDLQDLTIIIVTMDPAFAHCFYGMPVYTIQNQTAVFTLLGTFESLTKLNVWHSQIMQNESESMYMQSEEPIQIVDGTFTLNLQVNEIYTLTTLSSGSKGFSTPPPPPASFPGDYMDDFDSYDDHAEPYNLVSQAGVLEAVQISGRSGKVVKQTVPRPPIDTCLPYRMHAPVALIGDYAWSDVHVTLDFLIPAVSYTGVFLAVRVAEGGCRTSTANGIFLWVFPAQQQLVLTANANRSVIYGTYPVIAKFDTWHTMSLKVQGVTVTGSLDGLPLFAEILNNVSSSQGFVGVGSDSYSVTYYDNLFIKKYAIHDNKDISDDKDTVKLWSKPFWHNMFKWIYSNLPRLTIPSCLSFI